MAVFTKRSFSGSSGGRSIAIGTGLTTIHSSVTTGATDFDEMFFYVHNLASVSRKLTAYVGATLAKDKITKIIPSQDGLYLIGPGMILSGSSKILKALATGGAGASLTAHGFVNRIDQ